MKLGGNHEARQDGPAYNIAKGIPVDKVPGCMKVCIHLQMNTYTSLLQYLLLNVLCGRGRDYSPTNWKPHLHSVGITSLTPFSPKP